MESSNPYLADFRLILTS
jgi:hypothetical protein